MTKKIKVINEVRGYIEDMTAEEVLETFKFSGEPDLSNAVEIYRRMDYLEIVSYKEGHPNCSDFYKNVHGSWVRQY